MKPGTIIITTCKDIPLFCHHIGVVGKNGEVWNNTPAKENSIGGNVVRQPIREFMSGRKVIEIHNEVVDVEQIETYAASVMHKRWHPTEFNCEDFVEEAVTGKKYSLLKITWIGFLLIMFMYGTQKK